MFVVDLAQNVAFHFTSSDPFELQDKAIDVAFDAANVSVELTLNIHEWSCCYCCRSCCSDETKCVNKCL